MSKNILTKLLYYLLFEFMLKVIGAINVVAGYLEKYTPYLEKYI